MFPFENLPRADVRVRRELKAAADEYRLALAAATCCAVIWIPLTTSASAADMSGMEAAPMMF
jgi:hypothetical protein